MVNTQFCEMSSEKEMLALSCSSKREIQGSTTSTP